MIFVRSFYQNEIFSYLVMILIAIIISSGLILFSRYGGAAKKLISSFIGTFLGIMFLVIVIFARFLRGKFDYFSISLGIIGGILTFIGLALWKYRHSER